MAPVLGCLFHLTIHLAGMARQTRNGAIPMSDEQTTETAEPENAQDAPAQEPDWKKFSRQWEDRAKAANAELEELRKRASRLDEIEEAQKSEAEKLAEKVAKAEARAAELEASLAAKDREVLVQKVAAAKGVKTRYLSGETEEELMASADEYLEDVKGLVPERKPGVVPSSGTGDPKPAAASLDTGKARAEALLNPQSK